MLAGIDCSYDELLEQEADDLWNAGIRVFAQCLWTGAEQPPTRVINLRVAQQRGFLLVGYASLTSRKIDHMSAAKAGMPADLWGQLVRLPVDVELPGISMGQIDDAVNTVASWGKPRDIYTSYNQWVNVMGNPAAPANTGLWDANWDGVANLTLVRPYGNWTACWGKQYRGGSYINGQYADSNVFDLAGLEPNPSPPAASTKDNLRFLLNAALAEVEKLP